MFGFGIVSFGFGIVTFGLGIVKFGLGIGCSGFMIEPIELGTVSCWFQPARLELDKVMSWCLRAQIKVSTI
jgi:hypothetical protein